MDKLVALISLGGEFPKVKLEGTNKAIRTTENVKRSNNCFLTKTSGEI